MISMTGLKFGTTSNPALSWAMNCYVPALVCRRYRQSRIAAFSSGNVYGLVPANSGGSVETDVPCPVGEYAITVLGRERMFEYFSREWQLPLVLLRLNYATELRYGVLVDLAQKVLRQETIDVSMGFVNVIWQRDANAMALQSLEHVSTPPTIMNIAGPEILRVRDVAAEFARLTGRPLQCTGVEAADALLNNAAKSHGWFGKPQMEVSQILRWTADWVAPAVIASANPPTSKAAAGLSRISPYLVARQSASHRRGVGGVVDKKRDSWVLSDSSNQSASHATQGRWWILQCVAPHRPGTKPGILQSAAGAHSTT